MVAHTQISTEPSRVTLSRLYLGAVGMAGCGLLLWSLGDWHSSGGPRFLVYLIVALLGSGMKVILPGMTGTMSLNFLFVLIGLADFSLSETLSMGCGGILVQSVWHAKTKLRFSRIAFNVSSLSISIWAAFAIERLPWFGGQAIEKPVVLLGAATVFFALNTLFIACAIAVTEWKPLWELWRDGYFWSYPVYLVGGVVATLMRASATGSAGRPRCCCCRCCI